MLITSALITRSDCKSASQRFNADLCIRIHPVFFVVLGIDENIFAQKPCFKFSFVKSYVPLLYAAMLPPCCNAHTHVHSPGVSCDNAGLLSVDKETVDIR